MEITPIEALLKETKIAAIINPRVVQVSLNTSLRDTISLMQKQGTGCAIVTEGEAPVAAGTGQRRPVGIFTETDVVEKVLEREVDWARPISAFMTADIKVLSLEDRLDTAIEALDRHSSHHLPLVDRKGYLAGCLSARAVIRFLAEHYPTEVFNLPPLPDRITAKPEGG